MDYISNHASHCMQKRSVPPIVLDWLHDYGSEQYDGRGAAIRYFDRAAKERLKRVWGHQFIRANKKYLAVYIVEDVGGQSLITVGYRNRRIPRR
jgi:hypothetical protein